MVVFPCFLINCNVHNLVFKECCVSFLHLQYKSVKWLVLYKLGIQPLLWKGRDKSVVFIQGGMIHGM